MKVLLQAGAALKCDGQLEPTLHKAVRSGNIEVVQLVLDAGADVNEQADFAETPIHVAVEGSFAAIAALLISRGADLSLQSSFGGTALDIARKVGSEECVALLSNKH